MSTTSEMIQTQTLLHKVFPELQPQDVHALSEAATFVAFPKGVDICQEGDDGDTLYIIGVGKTDIIVHADNGQEIVVDRIGEGAYFGEMSLLGRTTRSATIRTVTDCEMLEISHAAFDRVTESNPGLLRRLLHRIIGHLQRNDRAVIHELNVANAELRKAYADLAEQESLRTKFIATLSHELRTPLTTIRGYLDLMEKGGVSPDSMPLAMSSISRNVERMVGLTHDMFLLYEMHPEEPNYDYVNLGDVVVDALKEARENMRDRTTAVQLEIDPRTPTVFADRQTLLLAVRAILENAFKHNPHKAPITLRTSRRNDEVRIAISDRGIGIPEKEQPRVFEPFYRLEREGSDHLFPGIGVGLTIAQFVVARHNGRIELDSQIGEGSTFTICLPAD